MSASSAEVQLANLFYMGLLWLREDNPKELTRRGASVFSSYILGGDLPRSVQTNIEQSYGLMKLVEAQSEVVTGKRPSAGKLKLMLAASDKLNIILAPAGEFELERLFAPGGYCHAITDAGIEHARSAMSSYPSIDQKRFLKGWGKYKNQIKAMKAKSAANQATQATQGVSDHTGEKNVSHIYIPRAPGYQDEW